MEKRCPSWREPVFLALLACVAYGLTLGNPFVFDDIGGIIENPALHALWPPWAAASSPPDTTPYGRPVVAWSLAANHALGGLAPTGYRLVNVALHLATGLVLLALGRRLVAATPGLAVPPSFPFLVASVWLLHPLCTSAVTYIVQRAEVGMSLCYAATLLCTARFCQAGPNVARGLWLSAVGCCAAGMLSKESMVTAPVAALCLDRAFFAATWREVWGRRKFFHASLAATWGVLAVCMVLWPRSRSVGFHNEALSAWGYFLMQTEVIVHYLRLLVWPVGLSIDYAWRPVPSPLHVLPEFLFLSAAGVAVVLLWRNRPRLAWLVGMPFLILSPTSSFVPVITAIASEHRMYLPSAFLIALLLLGIHCAIKRAGVREQLAGRLLVGVASGVMAALLVLTVGRNEVYASVESVWRDVLQKQPNNARAHNNLGHALWKGGRPAEAEECFRSALEKDPKHADAHYNYGTLLGQRGEIEEGLRHLEKAVGIWPDYAAAYANMGVLYFMQGDEEKGFQAYQQALKHRPNHVVANFNMAVISFQQGDMDRAEAHLRKVLTLQPGYPRARELLEDIQRAKR